MVLLDMGCSTCRMAWLSLEGCKDTEVRYPWEDRLSMHKQRIFPWIETSACVNLNEIKLKWDLFFKKKGRYFFQRHIRK